MAFVMVIDDRHDITSSLKRILEIAGGHIVLTANSIDEARAMIAAIESSPPDLIVCDGNIHIKDSHDGAQFALELQEQGHNVVTYSSYNYNNWGLRSYIKPLDVGGVLAMVQQSIRNC